MKRWLCSAMFLAVLLGAHPPIVAVAQYSEARSSSVATEVFRIAASSVVIVHAAQSDSEVAQGSGVVFHREPFDNDPWVATNCHVVTQASRVTVRFADKTYAASVLARDDDLDLCVLVVSELPAPAAKIRTAPPLLIGESVYAIGAPRGLELSLSDGIVSQFRSHPSTYRLIQTTAPISRGSSGGGLFDREGRLVGITTFFLQESQNLNFAIPATMAGDLVYATIQVSNMVDLAANPKMNFSEALDQSAPGWRQDITTPSFRRWLGLARDAKGERRTGNVSFLAVTALPPGDTAHWQPAAELFRDYRSSPHYKTAQEHQASTGRSGWQRVASWPGFEVYADRGRLRRQANRLFAWSLTDHGEVQQLRSNQYRSVVRVHEIECGPGRIATRQLTYYDGQMASGQIIATYTPDAQDSVFKLSFASPGTVVERLIAWACQEK